MKFNKYFYIIILVSFLFTPAIVVAVDDFPDFPMSFYGSATLDNEPLPVGAKIYAFSGEEIMGEVALSEAGIYGYNSPTKSSLVVGEYTGKIIFKYLLAEASVPITGDSEVAHEESFEAGSAIEFNINFTKKSVSNPNPPPSGGGGGGGGGFSVDTKAPALPNNFKAQIINNNIKLSWVNPSDNDFGKVVVVKSENILYGQLTYSGLIKVSDIIYEGKDEMFLDSNVNIQKKYYYAIVAVDKNSNYTIPIVITVENKTEAEEEDLEETVVLGVEYEYHDYKSLAGEGSDVVETVSQAEAQNILDNKTFVDLSEINKTIYNKIVDNYKDELNDNTKYNIAYFIQNGSPTTLRLGAGERAGALNSYIAAFGKMPISLSEWQDVIKIANGRWPAERNEAKEKEADKLFKKIYLREPNRANPHDDAAVTVIAYGLRPAERNMESEASAIKIFKNIFGYNPTGAVDWDIVRAIAYSGAIR